MSSKTRHQLPSIPPAFAAKKAAILALLAVPSSDYKDLSPKGSVDEGIKPLIEKINALDGVVTTSSCAGRVSVFLEGRKSKSSFYEGECGDSHAGQGSKSEQAVVAGGKGNGGRWLFVSHEPVDVLESQRNLMEILSPADVTPRTGNAAGHIIAGSSMRLVRFQFEPLILHIMTASLPHASSILTAAINAGFRESGLQSLKNLENPLTAFPILAIRTSGLALESVIGYVAGEDSHTDETTENLQRLVSEDYLALLLEVANERFQLNEQRKLRFSTELFDSEQNQSAVWESRQSRQIRMRADGLARQHVLRDIPGVQAETSVGEADDGVLGLLVD